MFFFKNTIDKNTDKKQNKIKKQRFSVDRKREQDESGLDQAA